MHQPTQEGIKAHILVNNFSFCYEHGLEYCPVRCRYDFRYMNNFIINDGDALEEWVSERLSDDRETIEVYKLGAIPTNEKKEAYKCRQHGTVDCGDCFDWVKILSMAANEEVQMEKKAEKWTKYHDKYGEPKE